MSTRCMLKELPHELVAHCVTFLPLKDILSLKGVHTIAAGLTRAPFVWRMLAERDFGHVPAAIVTTTMDNLKHNLKNDSLLPEKVYQQLHYIDGIKAVCWEPVEGTQLPRREGQAMTALHETELVLWGGFCSDANVYTMDTTCNSPTWTRCVTEDSNCPWSRYGHTLTGVGDVVFMFGGLTEGGYRAETDDLFCLSFYQLPTTATDGEKYRCTWDIRLPADGMIHPCIDCKRGYHSACYDTKRHQLLICCGLNDNVCTNSVLQYNISNNTWLVKTQDQWATAPKPRFGHSAQMYGDYMYVAGGYTGQGMYSLRDGDDLQDIWAYQVVDGTWSLVEYANRAPQRCLGRCHTSAIFGNKLLFFGGTMDATSKVHAFDLTTRLWITPKHYTKDDRGTEGEPHRISHSAALVGSSIWAFAGCNQYQRPQGGGVVISIVGADACLDMREEREDVAEGDDRGGGIFGNWGGMVGAGGMLQFVQYLMQQHPHQLTSGSIEEHLDEPGEDEGWLFELMNQAPSTVDFENDGEEG